jgi:hypothetical protein
MKNHPAANDLRATRWQSAAASTEPAAQAP